MNDSSCLYGPGITRDGVESFAALARKLGPSSGVLWAVEPGVGVAKGSLDDVGSFEVDIDGNIFWEAPRTGFRATADGPENCLDVGVSGLPVSFASTPGTM